MSGVAAVVPLYDPSPEAADGLRRLAAQVDEVVLVDDGSPTDVRAFVATLGIPVARLIGSPDNRGIAHALNLGIDAVRATGRADLVLTADQDSVLADDYVERALDAVRSLRTAGVRFAAVAAGVVDGKPNPGAPLAGTAFLTTHETIQSGMVFPLGSLAALGPFDESLFIDCVDTEYILRGRSRGLPTVLAMECRMAHAVGEGIAIRLPFFFRRRDRVVPFHPPVRRYYIVRNRIRLLRRYGVRDPRWALRQAVEQVRSAVADLTWGTDRTGLTRAMAAGLLDGLRGRGGRIPAGLRAVLERRRRVGGDRTEQRVSSVH